MTKSKKRRATESEDDKNSHCPFQATIIKVGDNLKPKKKSAKRLRQEPEQETKVFRQLSPFAQGGKFLDRTYPNLDVDYRVTPSSKWTDMTRYNSFVRKFYSRSFLLFRDS